MPQQQKYYMSTGGIVLAQTQQIPFYCLRCKQNFLAIKKKRFETGSQNLSFEVIAVEQKVSIPKLTGCKTNSFKRLEAKREKAYVKYYATIRDLSILSFVFLDLG